MLSVNQLSVTSLRQLRELSRSEQLRRPISHMSCFISPSVCLLSNTSLMWNKGSYIFCNVQGTLKTREWKTRHQTAGVENAGVEIAGIWKVWKAKISTPAVWCRVFHSRVFSRPNVDGVLSPQRHATASRCLRRDLHAAPSISLRRHEQAISKTRPGFHLCSACYSSCTHYLCSGTSIVEDKLYESLFHIKDTSRRQKANERRRVIRSCSLLGNWVDAVLQQ